ncbi:MAG: cell division protein FtsA [Nitrospinaceae bacterium]|jgi:cell division protein FtsA|nr:cell division protein FtsA [Nitrospinaceae bacterium]MBT4429186.1 cell division protein FtsA [Nitrospinaceae bacterium]MBT5949140.1 cell division protein FtsA [Nitrospinaceae bacterium]MBT6393707.1 cell division protein FtsA [Nitrospinaceae bacterium]MBT7857411.1 cell division protein FtsA [Nitrospinaceae bacterium]
MMKRSDVLVGLDIGTSKICVIVAEVTEDGSLEIVGLGKHASKGLNRGAVVNIDQTVESVRAAVEEAEFISGIPIRSAHVGVAGGHIRSFNSNGIVAIKNKVVDESDVERVIEQGRAVTLAADHEILHVLPQEYIVDDQEGITEPIGMAGVRLECKVHVVTGAIPAIQNIIRSVERAGLTVEKLVLQPLASSLAALSEDERDLGVAVVDIGSGTSDIAVISNGALKYSAVIPVGGNHVTRDIAIGLRTPDHQAERIKQEFGCALASVLDHDEEIEVPSVGGRPPRVLSRQMLAEIIEPRMEEVLTLIRREIQKSGYEDLLPAGVVLTGGASILTGTEVLAERILQLPVRLGAPSGISGLVDMVNGPMFSTGVGLVMYSMQTPGRNRNNWLVSNGTNESFRFARGKLRTILSSIFK